MKFAIGFIVGSAGTLVTLAYLGARRLQLIGAGGDPSLN